ncbi:MAG: hypothetical protein AB8B85_13385 [Paracoccaceae bacterium]
MTSCSRHPWYKVRPALGAIIGWLVIVSVFAVGHAGHACTPRLPGSPPPPAIESIYLSVWEQKADEPDGHARFRVIETYFGPVRETLVIKRIAVETLEAASGQEMVVGLNVPAAGVHEIHALGGCYPFFSSPDQIPDGQLEALVQGLETGGAQ